jgi:methyl-accepting chemotaxis protein
VKDDKKEKETKAPRPGKKSSLRFRFILFFTLFVLARTGVSTIVSLRQTIQVATGIFGQQGLPLVEKTIDLIDGDAFERLVQSLDPRDPFYEETRRQMLDLKADTNSRYLYTMARISDRIYRYIIDGSVEPEDEENFSPIGTDEDVSSYDPAFWKTLETETIQISNIAFQDSWGWMISVYAPIFNSQGRAVGIIGCDFDGTALYEIIRTQVIRQVLMSLGFVLLGLVMMFLFLRMIFQPLRNINGPMEQIAAGEGDLRVSIPVLKADEIGNLAENFNRFVRALKEIMIAINAAVQELTGNAEHLRQETSDMIDAMGAIFSGVGLIRDKAQDQNSKAQTTYDGVRLIESRIDSLGHMLATQLAAVDQSSSSIDQMNANIKAVTENMDQISRRYSQLVEDSQNGQDHQNKTKDNISQIVGQIENLTHANSAITKIAAQTNLLAMNAAIEAAHAGDAGRGFAVVAEEIRNLSVTATQQSSEIKQFINDIQNTILAIVGASEQSLKSYTNISADIEALSGMITRINGAMAEQNAGVAEILQAVKSVSDSAHSINAAAEDMKRNSLPVFAGIDELVQNTGGILEHSEASLRQTVDLQTTAERVLEIASRNGANAGEVMRIVQKFKI